jgi:hypothetical protein
VIVNNAIPGATVTLIVTRDGVQREVGKKKVTGSADTIPLDTLEALVSGDLVNASQTHNTDNSPTSTDGPAVQISVAQFSSAQVLSHLYQCSRGFSVGGVRPGTQMQVLQGTAVIGSGDAVDGTAFLNCPDGLPGAEAGTLTVRQNVCPKPALTPGSPGYRIDSSLPPVAPFPFTTGATVPAPMITDGLNECSRAVELSGVIPGADVILEGADGWWASLGPSDQTSGWLRLPVQLKKDETVEIRHEVSIRCKLKFERKKAHVGPKQTLTKPRLAEINCNTTPTILPIGLKPEADVEISVSSAGVETIYRTAATTSLDALPAPPMPAGSVVKIRQGECEVWSDWSDPQTAKALTVPPQEPKISANVFSCQDALQVENIFPLVGELRVMSKKYGELKRVPPSGNIMTITVAPSFTVPDDIWIEHHACGFVARSNTKDVKQGKDVVPGTIKGPLFDGDTKVLLTDAIAEARVELWNELTGTMLEAVRAPFGDTGFVNVEFSGFGPLKAGWKIYARTWHCGVFVPTQPSVPVVFKAPVLSQLDPNGVTVGNAALVLKLKGSDFRPGAQAQWAGVPRTTMFVSLTEIHANISASDLAAVKTVAVKVINPDGQATAPLNFTILANAPPPPVGFDEFVIQNCNTSFISGTFIHRPIHIYFRRTDLGPGDPWTPINDSPHDADYNAAGTCPASPSSGARFALDDGATYEVVCVDPDLPGCIGGDPDQVACRRSQVFTVHGKAGGGAKTVIVN